MDVATFTERLGVAIPERSSFDRIADLTALRTDGRGSFYRPNDARGPLLYALVASRRPASILEFGTGRGYAALCMARALVEHDVEGIVHTIDLVPHDRAFDWTLRDDAGARVETRSRQDVWRAFPEVWTERIVTLTGRSDAVARDLVRRRSIPPVDLAFVDGGHDHRSARHDLLASAVLSGKTLAILADDVVERPGYGVARAVRDLFSDGLAVTMLATEWGASGEVQGAMAWIEGTPSPELRGSFTSQLDRASRRTPFGLFA